MATDSLKITRLADARPVRLTMQLPADVWRDLELYAVFMSEPGKEKIPLANLAGDMIARFMGEDHAFLRRKKKVLSGQKD
ncbi:DUF2274 domain-containing protein [Acetobacter sp. DsW_063]|uniref:DUF2274 domain-containing protein n=1 Tax=Acetobacter sp. DsW_063 TaxID=1514894 RepID=UPI000A3BE2B3|nr:DUF2274 domain-containing protein [Acetobacter sp. DsW_063]OUJ14815.1 hypothetical protein HK28_11325 [Acetobacter sp. DsW_063]